MHLFLSSLTSVGQAALELWQSCLIGLGGEVPGVLISVPLHSGLVCSSGQIFPRSLCIATIHLICRKGTQ